MATRFAKPASNQAFAPSTTARVVPSSSHHAIRSPGKDISPSRKAKTTANVGIVPTSGGLASLPVSKDLRRSFSPGPTPSRNHDGADKKRLKPPHARASAGSYGSVDWQRLGQGRGGRSRRYRREILRAAPGIDAGDLRIWAASINDNAALAGCAVVRDMHLPPRPQRRFRA